MGRSLIFLVAALGMVISMAGTRMMVTSTATSQNAIGNFSRAQARNIAKSGIELAIMQLDSNKYWRRGYMNLAMTGGTLTLAAMTIDSSNVAVRSVGRYADESVPIATVIYIPDRNAPVPNWLKGAIICDQTLNLQGSSIVAPFYPTAGYNSDIHANVSVNVQGSVNVKGYASYAKGSFSATPISKIDYFLTPLYPIPGRALYREVDPIEIPDVILSNKAAEYDEFYPGDLVLNGNRTLGNAAAPRRIYVGGTLTINGTVSGYGFFYVKHSVNINGNVSINYPPTSLMQTLGLYTEQDINFGGNTWITAQIWTNGSLNSHGTVTIVGSVASRQSINWDGSINVKFLPANGAILPSAWKLPAGEKRPDLSSYWE